MAKQLLLLVLCLLLLVSSGYASERTWQTIAGGRITDGLTLEHMQLTPWEDGQVLTVQFDGEPGWYSVEYFTHPFSLILSVAGVRHVTAQLPTNSSLVASVNPLITLDDSMFRFYLELHRPVYIRAKAQADALVITLEEAPYDALSWDPRYSLRTQALQGEMLGVAEEDLSYLSWRQPRVIRSRDGFMVEVGLYATLDEAETAYRNLQAMGLTHDLVIEQRNPSQRPQPTASRFQPWRLRTDTITRDTAEVHVDARIPWIEDLPQHVVAGRWNQELWTYQIDQIDELEAAAQEGRKDLATRDLPFWPYVYASRFHPTRNDQEWLSFTTSVYQYRGGAHGLTVMRGWNYHIPSGRSVQLSDLFDPTSDYREIITDHIQAAIAQRPEDYFQPSFNASQLAGDQDVYLTDKGLVVFFGLYELAPYAVGIPEFFIPYEDLPPLKVGEANP